MTDLLVLRALYSPALAKGTELASVGNHLRREGAGSRPSSFIVDSTSFAHIPGSPFAYRISDKVQCIYRGLPRFEDVAGTVRQGLTTSDDFRFLRARWEVNERALSAATTENEAGGGGLHVPRVAQRRFITANLISLCIGTGTARR